MNSGRKAENLESVNDKCDTPLAKVSRVEAPSYGKAIKVIVTTIKVINLNKMDISQEKTLLIFTNWKFKERVRILFGKLH